MRFVIVGAGAVGGVLGVRMHRAGDDVVFVAHGEHGRVLRESGITLVSAEERVTLRVPTVTTLAEVGLRRGDVVVLAVKGQHTPDLLDQLVAVVDADPALERDAVPVVCLQNGVCNEREALRRFSDVHGVAVLFPTEHRVPGEVRQNSVPTPGILDVGRWPRGRDGLDCALRDAFVRAGFLSEAVEDISPRKYRKLVMNLGNAVELVCGPAARGGPLLAAIAAEGEAVLAAAGIAVQSSRDDLARRADHLRIRPIDGERRSGGSTWQSVARAAGSVEIDCLTGEILLLAREHGVSTPLNARILELAGRVAAGALAPGSVRADEVLATLHRVDRPMGRAAT